MSPHLADFLTRIFGPGSSGSPASLAACKSAFRKYLLISGAEYFNYGICVVRPEGVVQRHFIDINMDLAWQQEYIHEGFLEHDFVLNRALTLSRQERFAAFEFGIGIIPHLGAAEEKSGEVLRGAADAGMADGIALIGHLPREAGSAEQIVWGLALGGESGTGDRLASQLEEIKIAAFALFDRLRPELHRISEGLDPQLTPREIDVLSAFAAGLRRDRLAHRLGISLPTVDLHAANLRRKLDARTASEAVAKAFRYDLL